MFDHYEVMLAMLCRRLPVIVALATAITMSFWILQTYVSLTLACSKVLTTLNIPSEFCVKLVFPCRMLLSWSDHVAVG